MFGVKLTDAGSLNQLVVFSGFKTIYTCNVGVGTIQCLFQC